MTELDRLNLMNRNKKIIDIIMEQIKTECPDSIDMIAIGGSFCNGDIYEKSDLDLVIISRDEKAKCLDQCFILSDVAMDVYTHDWTGFERMSEYSNPYVTKLIDLDIVYAYDEEVIKRYKALQSNLLSNMNNDEIINKNVQKHFSHAVLELNNLNSNESDLGLAYRSLGHIMRDIEYVIYMINKSYVKRGTKRVPEEICSMNLLPDGFIDIYKDITSCKTVDEIKEKSSLLIECVKEFLYKRGIQFSISCEESEVTLKQDITPKNLAGTYEEIYSNWKNKMMHAVTLNSRYLSFVTMISCQEFYDEMHAMFNIPRIELLEYYNPDNLSGNVEAFNTCMAEWLKLYKQFGMEVNYYADLNELEGMYKKKKLEGNNNENI